MQFPIILVRIIYIPSRTKWITRRGVKIILAYVCTGTMRSVASEAQEARTEETSNSVCAFTGLTASECIQGTFVNVCKRRQFPKPKHTQAGGRRVFPVTSPLFSIEISHSKLFSNCPRYDKPRGKWAQNVTVYEDCCWELIGLYKNLIRKRLKLSKIETADTDVFSSTSTNYKQLQKLPGWSCL